MSAESPTDPFTPPRVAGDVEIARFPSAPDDRRDWRVSFGGRLHFLTDVETARRILALSTGSSGGTYDQAYRRYSALAGSDAESFGSFVEWCEKRRSALEELAGKSDGHPLKFRLQLLGEETCRRIVGRLGWLFRPVPVILLSLWCACIMAAAVEARPAGWQGSFALAALLALAGILVHEFGHITACVKHGARQGGIGVGLYWIWPAFYADVRGSWTLAAPQRLQVSVGGLYFQAFYLAGLATAALATANPTLWTAVQITLVLMFTTFNPVFKYDGYWILADWLDVINIHSRIAGHLHTLLGASGRRRRFLLGSVWTRVSVGFSLAAVGYVGYIGFELFRSVRAAQGYLAVAWRHAGGVVTVSDAVHQWGGVLFALVQILIMILALVVLGARSLRAMGAVFQGRGSGRDGMDSSKPRSSGEAAA